jgi:hypothetical protein
LSSVFFPREAWLSQRCPSGFKLHGYSETLALTGWRVFTFCRLFGFYLLLGYNQHSF